MKRLCFGQELFLTRSKLMTSSVKTPRQTACSRVSVAVAAGSRQQAAQQNIYCENMVLVAASVTADRWKQKWNTNACIWDANKAIKKRPDLWGWLTRLEEEFAQRFWNRQVVNNCHNDCTCLVHSVFKPWWPCQQLKLHSPMLGHHVGLHSSSHRPDRSLPYTWF